MGLTNEMFIQFSNDFLESADYENALALYIKKRTEAEQPKEFYSKVTIVMDGMTLEADSKDHYRDLIRDQFYQEFGITLIDSEIEVYEVKR